MAFALPALATTVGTSSAIAAAGATIGPVTAAASGLGTLSAIAGFAQPIFGGLSILSGAGAKASAQATNAALAEYNVQLAERNRQLAERAAATEAKDIRKETARRIGAARTKFAKAGVVTTSGSPLLVQEEIAAEGEIEAQRALFEGSIRAAGFESDALISGVRAKSLRQQARGTRTGGFLGAGRAILTGTGILS